MSRYQHLTLVLILLKGFGAINWAWWVIFVIYIIPFTLDFLVDLAKEV